MQDALPPLNAVVDRGGDVGSDPRREEVPGELVQNRHPGSPNRHLGQQGRDPQTIHPLNRKPTPHNPDVPRHRQGEKEDVEESVSGSHQTGVNRGKSLRGGERPFQSPPEKAEQHQNEKDGSEPFVENEEGIAHASEPFAGHGDPRQVHDQDQDRGTPMEESGDPRVTRRNGGEIGHGLNPGFGEGRGEGPPG